VGLFTRNGVTQAFFRRALVARRPARPAEARLLDYVLPHAARPGVRSLTSGSCRSPSISTGYSRTARSSASWWTSAIGPAAWQGSGPLSTYLGATPLRLVTGRLKRSAAAAVNFGAPDLTARKKWPRALCLACSSCPRSSGLPELENKLGGAADVSASARSLPSRRCRSLRPRCCRRTDDDPQVWPCSNEWTAAQRTDWQCRQRQSGARWSSNNRRSGTGAWRMLRMRRLAVEEGDSLVVLPRGRPLLESTPSGSRTYCPSGALACSITDPRHPTPILPRLRGSAEDGGDGGGRRPIDLLMTVSSSSRTTKSPSQPARRTAHRAAAERAPPPAMSASRRRAVASSIGTSETPAEGRRAWSTESPFFPRFPSLLGELGSSLSRRHP